MKPLPNEKTQSRLSAHSGFRIRARLKKLLAVSRNPLKTTFRFLTTLTRQKSEIATINRKDTGSKPLHRTQNHPPPQGILLISAFRSRSELFPRIPLTYTLEMDTPTDPRKNEKFVQALMKTILPPQRILHLLHHRGPIHPDRLQMLSQQNVPYDCRMISGHLKWFRRSPKIRNVVVHFRERKLVADFLNFRNINANHQSYDTVYAFQNPLTSVFDEISHPNLNALEQQINPYIFGPDIGLLALEPAGDSPPEKLDQTTRDWVRDHLLELLAYTGIYINDILKRMHIQVCSRLLLPGMLRRAVAELCEEFKLELKEGPGIRQIIADLQDRGEKYE